nr:PH domain-containing protein [Clostridium tertium]
MGTDKSWALKHFQLIEKSLGSDEEILMCFIGLHNYISSSKHDSNFAYAVTNKRIIMAQKKMLGEIIQTVSLKNVNDITMTTGAITGIITIDTVKETFNVAINKSAARNINDKIHELILDIQESKVNSSSQKIGLEQTYSSADEILKFKELFDMGVITEEEFNIKKKQILGI